MCRPVSMDERSKKKKKKKGVESKKSKKLITEAGEKG